MRTKRLTFVPALLIIFVVTISQSQSVSTEPQQPSNSQVPLPPTSDKSASSVASMNTDFPQPETSVAAAKSIDRVAILDPKHAKPGSTVRMEVSGASLSEHDFLSIFGGTYSLQGVSADGTSAYANVVLPSDYNADDSYSVLVASSDGSEKTDSMNLDTGMAMSFSDENQLKSQSRKWEKQSKQMERYAKAGQRYALDLARVKTVQQQVAQAQNGKQTQIKPYSAPSNVSAGSAYCQPDSAQESASIRVRRGVMDPKEASDAFGRRIGRRYIVYQITIENNNKNYQYMIHDVSIDLSRLFGQKPGTYEWAFSTRELSLLRGVPEKGQDLDPRNLTFHVLRGIGSVAGGIAGLTPFVDVFGSSVAAYNGPFLSAFSELLPDHTATQLNRLSDSAFSANSVVGKQQAKAFAVFVPQALFMTGDQQKEYWKQPIDVLSSPSFDFRNADLCVDGAFVTEVAAATLTKLVFADPTKAAPNATVSVKITGTGLASGDTLNLFGNTYPIKDVGTDGTSADADVKLPSDYDTTKQYAGTLSSKTGEKSNPIQLLSPKGLSLTSIAFADPKSAAPNAQVILKLGGANLSAGDDALVIFGQSFRLDSVSDDATSAQSHVTLPGSYSAHDQYPAFVTASSTGEKTATTNLPAASSASPGKVSLKSVTISAPSKATANATSTISINGTDLPNDGTLELFGSSYPLKNVSADATSAQADVKLPADYDPKKQYPATVTAKDGTKSNQVNLETSLPSASRLSLKSVAISDPSKAASNSTVTISITGAALTKGAKLGLFGSSYPLKNVSADATSAQADVKLPADYDPKKQYPATVTAKDGTKSNQVNLETSSVSGSKGVSARTETRGDFRRHMSATGA